MFRYNRLLANTIRLAAFAVPSVMLGCVPPPNLDEITDAAAITNKDGTLQITSVNPTMATTDGDRIALVRGSGFVPGMTVMFGDDPAKEVTFVSDSMITAVVPPSQAGPADITLMADVEGVPRTVALPESFTFVNPPADDGTDTDGDGLTDVQEQIIGYRIRVDFLGLGMNPAHLTRFNVNSDPLDPDTDDDGLLDSEEFFANTNPRDRDTDTDGLWDGEEAKRWLTSPISVDSDGDARASDPSTDRSTIPPVFDLFDGLELYTAEELVKDPALRGPIKLNATSPTLDDTDGDSESDFEEFDTPVRTPLLADMPQLLFEIVDQVDVRLDVEYAEEVGTSTAFETSFETGTLSTESASQSNTVSSSVTVGAQLSLLPFEGLGLSAEVTAGREQSWETTQESTVEASQTVSQLQEKSRTNTETAASGSITAGVRISNLGNITVQVVDLVHTVRQWLPNANADTNDASDGSYVTLAALAPDLGPGLTLSPGSDSGVLLAIDEDVNPDRIKDLLARPDSLQLQSAAYELVNDEGFNFAFIDEVTQARTARVSVDFGDGRFEEYRVATNVDRNADGSLAGISLARALDMTVGVGNWATETINNPCGPQVANLITNGSFESPVGSVLNPDAWTQRQVSGPGGSDPMFGVIGAGGSVPPPPVGNQWLLARVDAAVPTVNTRGIYQQIGTAGGSSVDYDYSFQVESISTSEFVTNYTIALYAGVPGAGGTSLVDSQTYGAGNLEAGELATITGTLSGGVVPGTPMYFELSVDSAFFFADQPPYLVLFDDLQVYDRLAPPVEPIEVISQIRDTSYDIDLPRFWSIFRDGQPLPGGADFSMVTLSAGDAVLLALQQDVDGDGLYASQEQQYGSSDSLIDTDGDGLSDADEAARNYALDFCTQGTGGWNVTVTNRDGSTQTTRVYSDPARTDADQDGLADGAERAGGTNPNNADTDGDGLRDAVDPNPTVQAAVLHVRPNGNNAGGLSWTNAFSTLQPAFDAATAANSDGNLSNDISEIWVAQGTYSMAGNLTLPNDVPVYGGFAGNETRLAQRIADGAINGTIISGNGFIAVNNQSVILDGFFFDGGSIDTVPLIQSLNSTCVFRNLYLADRRFSALEVFNFNGESIILERCGFANNRSFSGGAAIAHQEGALTLIDCEFVNNVVESTDPSSAGGAIWAQTPDATLDADSCRFRSNAAIYAADPSSGSIRGGAVSMYSGTISNCEFRGNKVTTTSVITNEAWTDRFAGGALQIVGDATVVNSVFFDNEAIAFGGAIFVTVTGDDEGDARIVNTTVANNSVRATSGSSQVGGQWCDLFNNSNCFNIDTRMQPVAVGAGLGVSGIATSANAVAINSIFYGNTSNADTIFWCRQGICEANPALSEELQVSTTPAVRPDWFEANQEDLLNQWYLVTLNWPVAARGQLETRNCCVEGLGGELAFDPSLNVGNIGADPQFLDPTSGNLRVPTSSPVVDAGTNVVDTSALAGFQPLPLFDLSGNPRAVDGNGDGNADVDMGAYEAGAVN